MLVPKSPLYILPALPSSLPEATIALIAPPAPPLSLPSPPRLSTNIGGPKVYDVTKYLEEHPGGSEVLLDHAGKYADEMFEDIGHSGDAKEKLKTLLVGELTVRKREKRGKEEDRMLDLNFCVLFMQT